MMKTKMLEKKSFGGGETSLWVNAETLLGGKAKVNKYSTLYHRREPKALLGTTNHSSHSSLVA